MRYSFLICCLYFFYSSLQANEVNTLLKALDNSIPKRMQYIAEKEEKLEGLKKEMSQASALEQKYALSKELTAEYSYYICDSALFYVDNCLQLAQQLQNENYIFDVQMDQAYLMYYAGMIPESFKILESIDPETLSHDLLKKYYYTYVHVYHNHIKSLNFPPYIEMYKNKALGFIDKYLELGYENKADYFSILAYKYYIQKNYKEAAAVVNQLLELEDITPYMRAVALYNLGGVYLEAGGEFINEAKKTLAKASIIANELVMTKHSPLLNLAMLLANENRHVNRAYNYIHIASEDMLKFNGVHIASLVDKTNNAKQNLNYIKIKRQRIQLQVIFFFLMIFCLLIIVMLFKLVKNNKILTGFRYALSEANAKLRDSNRIKDTYIIHFLNRYSIQINKVDGFKKHIIRQLNTSQSNDAIKKEAIDLMNTHEDLNNLYAEFDKSVLELYPNFIEKVNELLKDDKKYGIDNQGKLNTELRILALLRLGINDQKQIASFFRFTLQTVYNYRSKAKARAIHEDTFEEDIKNICNYT